MKLNFRRTVADLAPVASFDGVCPLQVFTIIIIIIMHLHKSHCAIAIHSLVFWDALGSFGSYPKRAARYLAIKPIDSVEWGMVYIMLYVSFLIS